MAKKKKQPSSVIQWSSAKFPSNETHVHCITITYHESRWLFLKKSWVLALVFDWPIRTGNCLNTSKNRIFVTSSTFPRRRHSQFLLFTRGWFGHWVPTRCSFRRLVRVKRSTCYISAQVPGHTDTVRDWLCSSQGVCWKIFLRLGLFASFFSIFLDLP